MWSGMVPGKSLELNTTCEPGRSSACSVNGANTPTQSNWPPANAPAAASVSTPRKSMSSSVSPTDARPWSRRKWSTTPSSAAIVLPFRSLIVFPTDLSQMIASLPAELSFTTTIDCLEPAATPAIVSLSVWVLASRRPADIASSDPM